MSYYSELVFDSCRGKLNENRLEEMKKFYKKYSDDVFASIKVKQEGDCVSLDFGDYGTYAKYYYDAMFAAWLSYVLEEGELVLLFYGEDGSNWGYKIRPGEVIEMGQVWHEKKQIKYPEEINAEKEEIKESIKMFNLDGYDYFLVKGGIIDQIVKKKGGEDA